MTEPKVAIGVNISKYRADEDSECIEVCVTDAVTGGLACVDMTWEEADLLRGQLVEALGVLAYEDEDYEEED